MEDVHAQSSHTWALRLKILSMTVSVLVISLVMVIPV
jgi:hypothetical protein